MADSADNDEPSRRNAWRDAVWGSTNLTPSQKLAGLCYAAHAKPHGHNVWVTTARAVERTSMSKSTWERAVAVLRDAGWLRLVSAARSGRDGGRASEYDLTIPDGMRVTVTSIPENERHCDQNERHCDQNERHCDQNERHSDAPIPAVTPAVTHSTRVRDEPSQLIDESDERTTSSSESDWSGPHWTHDVFVVLCRKRSTHPRPMWRALDEATKERRKREPLASVADVEVWCERGGHKLPREGSGLRPLPLVDASSAQLAASEAERREDGGYSQAEFKRQVELLREQRRAAAEQQISDALRESSAA